MRVNEDPGKLRRTPKGGPLQGVREEMGELAKKLRLTLNMERGEMAGVGSPEQSHIESRSVCLKGKGGPN